MTYEPDWYQQVLTPPDVLEATVKIGVLPGEDHVQTYWEVKDPTTGVLLAAGSVHRATLHGMHGAIERAVRKVQQALADHVEPF